MSLRVGIDFGTATTCVAYFRGAASLAPHFVEFENQSILSDSKVWFDRDGGRPELIGQLGSVGRRARSIFSESQLDFEAYWARRVRARSEGRIEQWKLQGHEADMLLSYFKPELSDEQTFDSVPVASVAVMEWDPSSQSQDVQIHYSFRRIASPAPATEDLVAGMASILRQVGRSLVSRTDERISRLTLGIPSLSPLVNRKEYDLAVKRREDALTAAGFASDFCTSDLRTDFLAEGQAAGRGVEETFLKDADFLVVVDSGAGTTDFSFVELDRDQGATRFGRELRGASSRFAGRDFNAVIATWLASSNSRLRNVLRALDPREWQVMLDREMENAKRALSNGDKHYTVRVSDISSTLGLTTDDENLLLAMRSTHTCSLRGDIDKLSWHLERATLTTQFSRVMDAFLDDCARIVSGMPAPTVNAVLVGGGFRFSPFRDLVRTRLRRAFGESMRVGFRNSEAHLQASVAVGLARASSLS